MVKVKRIITIILIATVSFSLSVENYAYSEEVKTVENVHGLTTDWSINATDAEANELIRRAEMILNQSIDSPQEPAKAAAIEELSAEENNTVPLSGRPIITPASSAVNSDTGYDFMPENSSSGKISFNANMLNWLPGILAIAISIITALIAYSQLRKSRRAGRQASSLIAEVKDLQKNLREWEQNCHNIHLDEIASHIEALNDTIVTAKETKAKVSETINKGISLNQKSLEILKKANKELGKSLASEVSVLKHQLTATVEAESERLSHFAQEQINTLKNEKDSLLQAVEQKNNELKLEQNNIVHDIEKHNHEIDTKQQSTTSMIDIITNELNMLKSKNSTTTTTATGNKDKTKDADKSHADMLRESIARQRSAISGSSLFSGLSGHSSMATSNSSDIKGTENTIKADNTLEKLNGNLKPETKGNGVEHSQARQSVSIQKESTITTTDGIAITTRDISINRDKGKDNQNGNTSKYSGLNSKELMEKLSHAEKWHNFKVAAEICQEMALRSPEKSEVYDIWGQMLARQGSIEKGQGSNLLLKEAAQKMQKASLLDSSNYKIFNNWGVILKNLALNCTDNQEMEKNLAIARRKFETSLSLNPQNHEALNNWGNTLMIQARLRTGAMQESLLKSACEKFAEAVALKPDKEVSLYSWGNALFRLANCKTDKETRNRLLAQAQESWEKANRIKPGIASKELRVIRSMVPPLSNGKSDKKVTEYKFKTISS